MACIVRLNGGLGNQLFQYAIGRAVAHRCQSELLLDTTLLNSRGEAITPRSYALAPFQIAARVMTAAESANAGLPTNRVDRLLARLGVTVKGRRYVVERGFRHNPAVLRLGGNLILEGFWQSERYFSQIRSLLLEELSLDESTEVGSMAQRMQREESVGVHVRRGDYLTNPAASAVHGVCPPSYYQQSMSRLQREVGEPRYYIFTDDPAWVSKNRSLFGPNVTLIADELALQPYEELVLMSRCRHNIIANSSFSWWGAWLNMHEDARIIAPANWFLNGIDTSDLIPSRWLRV